MTAGRYDLHITATAARALSDRLTPAVAFAAWDLIDGALRDNPRRVGRPLRAPFAGQRAARRSTYRIRYRIDDDKHVVVVLDITGRADAYRPRQA